MRNKRFDLSVTVSNNTISVSRDPLDCEQNRPCDIYWSIPTSGWNFDATAGITFKNDEPSPQFNRHRDTTISVWHCSNQNSLEKSYRYTINLVNASTGLPLTKDPAIQNHSGRQG
jgi:hypothetical protein